MRTQCAHSFSAIFVIAVIAPTFGVNWSIGVATETGSEFEGGFLSSFLAGSQVGLSSHGSFDHLGVSFKGEWLRFLIWTFLQIQTIHFLVL